MKIAKPKHIGYRPTWAEVSLGNLAYNLGQIKSAVCAKTKIMVCVKADAYGHGLIPVVKKLASLGVDYFGVASIDEGIALRREKVRQPILIMGMALASDIAPLFSFGLIPTVCTEELAHALDRRARRLKQKIPVHIKVDTGMGRIGIFPKDALCFIRKMHRLKGLWIEGLFTHFAFADLDRNFTLRQLSIFERLVEQLRQEGIEVPLLHAANSMAMAVADYKKSHLTMVRPGLIVYGLKPVENFPLSLKPVLSLKTKIVFHKRVPAGCTISYGRTYITKRPTTVVTLPIGYGDGYPRNLSSVAPILIKGRRFTLSGIVCMDQAMVDVGDLPVKIGDEAVLIGRQGLERISAEELAGLSGTISYEIVCGLGSRVPRVYTK